MKNLASHILDIVQNSIRAEATKVEIKVTENQEKDSLVIEITDNGSGMDEAILACVSDPFFTSRTVRKVGLGIPLLRQNAERTGGKIKINSNIGKGTTIYAWFTHSHLDCPPLGDIAGTVSLLMASNPDIQFIYKHTTAQGSYVIDTGEIKGILENVPLSHPDIIQGICGMIRENLKDIKADY